MMLTANWANRTLFHGDNLGFLRAMNSESVDLIATDPPFNKGRDFHATPDSLASGAKFQDRWSWAHDVHEEWSDQIRDDYPYLMEAIESARYAHSDGMGAFMCFMAVRLLEMRRVLKKSGSIYLHCDPTASHYLKACMDAIFGWQRFRSEIIWRRSNAHSKTKMQFGPIHDVILFYSRSLDFTFHAGTRPYSKAYIESRFTKTDERGRYQTNYLTGPGKRHGGSGKEWRGFDPTDANRHWAIPRALRPYLPDHGKGMTSQEQLEALWSQDLIVFPKKPGGQPMYKQYVGNGVKYQDVWAYQPNTKGTLFSSGEHIDEDVKWLEAELERIGYPTQKPVGLYERMIRTSSNEGDIVCDPFAGCATTLIAAERLRRHWVGIDIWCNAKAVVLKRMAKERLALPEAERHDLFTEEIHFTATPPKRTDDGLPAAPALKLQWSQAEPPGPQMSRAQMYDALLASQGAKCQGCNRVFDDPRYLELDHNIPRSDGGLNHISNRILLCGPCNKLKSNIYTLSGLQRENRKRGYLR